MSTAFRGTTSEQDNRFSNKQSKLLNSIQFPPLYNQYTIHTNTVSRYSEAVEQFISTQLTQLNGFDDDVLNQLVYNILTTPNTDTQTTEIDPKPLHIQLIGFLNQQNTTQFMTQLWTYLYELQAGKKITQIDTKPAVNDIKQDTKSIDTVKYGLNDTKSNGHHSNNTSIDDKSHINTDIKPENGDTKPTERPTIDLRARHADVRDVRYGKQPVVDKHSELKRRLYGNSYVDRHSRSRSVSPRRDSRSPVRYERSSDRHSRHDRDRYHKRRYSPDRRDSRSPVRRHSDRDRYHRRDSRDRYDERRHSDTRYRSRSISPVHNRTHSTEHLPRQNNADKPVSPTHLYIPPDRRTSPHSRPTSPQHSDTNEAVSDTANTLAPVPAHLTSDSTQTSLEALEALRKKALANLKARRAQKQATTTANQPVTPSNSTGQ